jgi:hypothetical protein
VSWLLFLDESGHDHKTMPYEVNGGIAIHASRLWPFIQAVRTLEQSVFGTYLHGHGSEVKGCKLLDKKRFTWEQQSPRFDDQARRKHSLNFLNSSQQGRTPWRDEFTAFGQACIQMAEGIFLLLKSHGAVVFASIIPPLGPPPDMRNDVPRKDIVFLLERYFYFLQERDEMGLLADTMTGLKRAQWVVPSPLFVDSEMTYGVQVADLCIYAINWGYRYGEMTAPIRKEIEPFVMLFEECFGSATIEREQKRFKTHSIVFVPDPYTGRSVTQKEKKR